MLCGPGFQALRFVVGEIEDGYGDGGCWRRHGKSDDASEGRCARGLGNGIGGGLDEPGLQRELEGEEGFAFVVMVGREASVAMERAEMSDGVRA